MKTTKDNIFYNAKYDENFDNELKIELYHITKDEELLDKIILNNMPLVIRIANHVGFATKVDKDDLIQEGLIALMDAIESYNGSVAFSTYAYHCVFNAIHGYVKTEYCYSSATYGEFMKKFKSVGYKLYGKYINFFKEPYLTDVLNVMVDEGIIYEIHKPIIRSLIPTSFEENRKLCSDVMYDDTDDNLKEIYNQIGKNIDYLLSDLDPTDQLIVKLKTGFYTGDELTLTEIGHLFGKSHEYVRTHFNKSLPKIKKRFDSLS